MSALGCSQAPTPARDQRGVSPLSTRRVAVVGAGWAGLAAAVRLQRRGHEVTLFEMARHAGGRARSPGADRLDNGQHILIGAYRQTLALMREVGVDTRRSLLRRPLVLAMADGRRLALPPGPAQLAFARAVLHCRGWSTADRLSLLRHALRWQAAGFRCEPDTTVDQLCAGMADPVRELLVDPLCVAALNTPAREASAQVFLRVLHDGLFSGPGASDLLLPRVPLHDLWPDPALQWLQRQGAQWRPGHRVQALSRRNGCWQVDGEAFGQVVLACSAQEAARLCADHAPAWSEQALALAFEPIVTVYLQHDGLRLPEPMLGLREDAQSPAQFVFDRGQLDGRPGLLAFVVSGAAAWVKAGQAACTHAVRQQAAHQLAAHGWRPGLVREVDVLAERRATFRSTPGLCRPGLAVAAGLWAAADYVSGPYPATLEGAMRAGCAAAEAVDARSQRPFHDAE